MHKEKKERMRQEKRQAKEDAHASMTSYINRDQYHFLYESVLDINKKIQDHSKHVDEIEQKLLEVSQLRKRRKE